MKSSKVAPRVDADLFISEARTHFGATCLIVDSAGRELGPSPINWVPHYDFERETFWCNSRVSFENAPAATYVGIKALSDTGELIRMLTFDHPVVTRSSADGLTVSLTTRG